MFARFELHHIAAGLALVSLLALDASLAAAAQPAPVAPAVTLANRADSYLRAGELHPPSERASVFYRHAVELAEQALALDPASARANFVYFGARGRILMNEGATRNVIELQQLKPYLERSLATDPEYPDALAAKGGMLLELPKPLGGDPHEAERILQRAVTVNPTGPSTRFLYAKALLKNGKLTAAHEQLRKTSHYASIQRRYLALVDAQKLWAEVDSKIARKSD